MFSLVFLIAFFVLLNWCWWRILAKMGILGMLRLGLLVGCWVPVIGLPMVLFYLGFVKWPIHEELEALEKKNKYLATRKFPSSPRGQQ